MGNDTSDKAAGRLTQLTPRQCQVLQLAAGGANNAEIATVLGIRFYTVKRHMNSVASRYWLVGHGRTALVMEGIRRGDVDELLAYADVEMRRCE